MVDGAAPAFNLASPHAVMQRLSDIEADLAKRQIELERAAQDWFHAKREKERDWAVNFLRAEGTDGKRRVIATAATALDGSEEEARFESLKAVVRTLDTRAAIGMSILRAQSRV